MNLTPDSWGSTLSEVNHCHGPGRGHPCMVPGQGRALGIKARKAARRDESRLDQAITGAQDEHGFVKMMTRSGQKLDLTDPRTADWKASEMTRNAYYRRLETKSMAANRRDARTPLPAYMKRDAADAWKADRAISLHDPNEHPEPGLANQRNRTVNVRTNVRPGFMTKTEQLSVLRHEHGHIDKTPLGRGGEKILGRTYSPQYNEELRAWKNAIRNSGGKVDFNTVRAGLGSYLRDEGLAGTDKAILNQHITLLKRYARKIRTASRGL